MLMETKNLEERVTRRQCQNRFKVGTAASSLNVKGNATILFFLLTGQFPNTVTCDSFWENLPKHVDTFFVIYFYKLSVTTYLSYGASFDATLAVVLMV